MVISGLFLIQGSSALEGYCLKKIYISSAESGLNMKNSSPFVCIKLLLKVYRFLIGIGVTIFLMVLFEFRIF